MRPLDTDDDPLPLRLRTVGDMAGWSGPPLPAPIAFDDRRTAGQKRRAARDVVIAVAVAAGLSHRFVARALGMSKSRVTEVAERCCRKRRV